MSLRQSKEFKIFEKMYFKIFDGFTEKNINLPGEPRKFVYTYTSITYSRKK